MSAIESADVLMRHSVGAAVPQLKAHLARAEVERDAAEGLEQVGAEQQRRLVGEPEHLERRHVGKGDRHILQA